MKNVWIASLVVALSCSVAHAQESSPATRAALAHQLFDASIASMSSGAGRAADAYEWSVRWLRADLEAHVPNATQAHFDRMNTLLAMAHGQVLAGTARTIDELACQYYVAEARAWIAARDADPTQLCRPGLPGTPVEIAQPPT